MRLVLDRTGAGWAAFVCSRLKSTTFRAKRLSITLLNQSVRPVAKTRNEIAVNAETVRACPTGPLGGHFYDLVRYHDWDSLHCPEAIHRIPRQPFPVWFSFFYPDVIHLRVALGSHVCANLLMRNAT